MQNTWQVEKEAMLKFPKLSFPFLSVLGCSCSSLCAPQLAMRLSLPLSLACLSHPTLTVVVPCHCHGGAEAQAKKGRHSHDYAVVAKKNASSTKGGGRELDVKEENKG